MACEAELRRDRTHQRRNRSSPLSSSNRWRWRTIRSELCESRATFRCNRTWLRSHLHFCGSGPIAVDNKGQEGSASEDVPCSVELRWRPGEHQAALT
jgi:hypothetical protein